MPSTSPPPNFIDHSHPTEDQYWVIMDQHAEWQDHTTTIMQLNTLIQQDPTYCDPYISLAELYEELGDVPNADNYRELAYLQAEAMIKFEDRWPERLEWGQKENRHLLRAMLNHCIVLWRTENIPDAINILHQMLRMDPVDNAGARFYILGIRLGFSWVDYREKFISDDKAFVNPDLFGWFDTYSPDFPEDFAAWEQEVKKLMEDY